jgi:hypothetical protein
MLQNPNTFASNFVSGCAPRFEVCVEPIQTRVALGHGPDVQFFADFWIQVCWSWLQTPFILATSQNRLDYFAQRKGISSFINETPPDEKVARHCGSHHDGGARQRTVCPGLQLLIPVWSYLLCQRQLYRLLLPDRPRTRPAELATASLVFPQPRLDRTVWATPPRPIR